MQALHGRRAQAKKCTAARLQQRRLRRRLRASQQLAGLRETDHRQRRRERYRYTSIPLYRCTVVTIVTW